jgi:mRNA-degrading endonuclease RelE of RelBE toxin-antitoxin system
MYQRVITPSAKRSLKKLPISLRKEMINATKILEENPLAGEKLSGSLNFLYSFHFKYQDVQYRVAYTIDPKKKLVIIHFADKRENFYEKLRALFR